MSDLSSYILNNGVKIPAIGFGTILPEGAVTVNSVRSTIEAGYRLIDSAEAYNNEVDVGREIHDALHEDTINRDELFISDKVWYRDRSYADTVKSIDDSLSKMKLSYFDLYLMHWLANATWHRDWRELNDERRGERWKTCIKRARFVPSAYRILTENS